MSKLRALRWDLYNYYEFENLNNIISHLLYFLHRPGWEFILIICPLKATREIMAINLSPQAALHLSILNAHSHTCLECLALY